MKFISLIVLICLGFIALLYTVIGLQFGIGKRRSRYLLIAFILGIAIGIFGGLSVIYNLKISGDAVFFYIEPKRWMAVTLWAVLLGGILSLFIFVRTRRK